MTTIARALSELGIKEWVLRGEPTSEAEFNSMFRKVTGADSNGSAIESADPKDWGTTWKAVSDKKAALIAAAPMVELRRQRNAKLAETDYLALSDVTLSADMKTYRQALRHAAMPTGSVLQVQRTRLTSVNTQALTQNTVTAITGLSVNITPKFSNSLIRLDAHFFGELGSELNTFNNMISFMRDTTELHETAVGNRNYGYGTLTRTYAADDAGSTPE